MNPLFLTCLLLAAAPQQVRDGFERRVLVAFEENRGKPFKPVAKMGPLRKGAGNYTRGYSYSVVDFATRCFVLGEQIDAANAALIDNAQYYLDNPATLADRDSFHWHAEMLCRLIEHYGSRGSVAPGRMNAAAQDVNMRVLLQHASLHVPMRRARLTHNTWNVDESENHHLQAIVSGWHTARLGALYADTYRYADGTTPAQNRAAWNGYLKAYLAQRARKGMHVEVASDNYTVIGLKGVYNVYDFADDPELKRRAGMFIELFWALWAQEQIDGVRGGGKCRIYQNGNDRYGAGHTHASELAWFYFGIEGAPKAARCPLLAALTSTWRPSLLVTDLAIDVEGRGRYAIHMRPLGLADEGAANPPDYLIRSDYGAMHRYTWCTPAYVMGTIMLDARPWEDWTAINAQNRWHGVIFAGDPHARIVPQVRAADSRSNRNQQWSVQSRGAMICQKLRTSRKAKQMRVWFADRRLAVTGERGGWVFAEAAQAYAAVRVMRGSAAWEPSEDRVRFGKWLACDDEFAPVAIQVAEKADYAGADTFAEAVLALPCAIDDARANFTSLAGDVLTLPVEQVGLPAVNGTPIDLAYPMAYESPFVTSPWDSGIITLRKGDRTATLDFKSP